MVKSKFPGKPSKHFQRRKVSPGINIEDFEGLKAAEEIYCRLSVFEFLFREEEEVSSFHGFSPHEINVKHEADKKIRGDINKSKKKSNADNSSTSDALVKNTNTDLLTVKSNDAISAQNLNSVSVESDICATEINSNEINMEKVVKKNNIGSSLPLSGKFILPSRSAHSSRVIKPNKRFLQSDGIGVPYKKQRLRDDEETIQSDNIPEECSGTENMNISECNSSDNSIVSSDNMAKSKLPSPVKFVLRKPRLKIKSQPFSKVEGPFSSPVNRSGPHAGSKYRSCLATKVVCGVCWTVRSYKFLKQARKFGIFACEPCRRFILKILKTEREELLHPLLCTSGTGNCPIRNSTFVSQQPFATPVKKSSIDGPRRCQACWLNLCLRSFKMPVELSKRLASYLPQEILLKYPIDSIVRAVWNEPPKKPTEARNAEVAVVKVIKKRKPDEMKKVKNRQKLLLAGPRVKHVCRSASLVLGQPAATFMGGCAAKSDSSSNSVDDDQYSTKSSASSYCIAPEMDAENESSKKQELFSSDKDNISKEKSSSSLEQQPVARMLQDLGRANCELLDGIELHESEKKFAKISIDFWESYDPEEVLQSGFPLLGCNPFTLRAVCFLCGSAGYEKLVHCACCCEPYHTFCVSPSLHFASKDKNWWKLDWLCPKCVHCEICSKPGGVQLTCSKCSKSYHNNCVPPGRAHISDNSWVCPSCLFCKSCNDTQVHVFIGNVPLCKNCFKQRKKGNYCPLCQRCYDENDYSTKMMECSDCKSWIHAKCEGLSDEKYQVLSNLPSTIEFICRNCCKDPPALWSVAVNAELKAGYLNVIRALSKNRSICSYLKTSPKKMGCVCQDDNIKPIHLKNLTGHSEISLLNNKITTGSPLTITDEKNTDLGLLTPKLTKDDEESLQTVKSGFLNIDSANKDGEDKRQITMYSLASDVESKNFSRNGDSQLLSIACTNSAITSECTNEKLISENVCDSGLKLLEADKTCSCIKSGSDIEVQSLSLMVIKNKAMNDDYASTLEFNRDVEKVLKEIGRLDILKIYYKSLRQIFPWFNPRDSINYDSNPQELDVCAESKLRDCRKSIEGGETDTSIKSKADNDIDGLLCHDQSYYYLGVDFNDNRTCMLCKLNGEGSPIQEGRLLYCGQNEWVHVNCALWSSEVFEEIDGSLQNVHSAISRARLIRCFGCDKKGASVGCCAKSCPSAYHFRCAINASCVFLENKEVFCKMHRNLRSAKEVHKEEDFLIARSVYVELDHKKKKDVFRNEVRLYLGSLAVISLGEIVPELSDMEDILVPCEYHCSRLYWSIREPWKLVRYYIKTKLTTTYKEQIVETDTNYTIDHSLEFTPPPSPVDNIYQIKQQHSVDDKDIKFIVNHIIDTVCNKEEENNIAEHSANDLLPPELKEAIFEDLPHDLLDGISMHDIFTKMNFDDVLSEVKQDKMETFGESSNVDVKKNFTSKEQKRTDEILSKNKFIKNSTKSHKNLVKAHNFFRDRKTNTSSIKEEQFLNKVTERNWKPYKLLQVDGALDFSESDQSDDSCDMITELSQNHVNNINVMEDDPVKCSRCHRTYRSNVGYERHLSTCNTHYLSSSEGDSSEEEKEKTTNNIESNQQCNLVEYNSSTNQGPLTNSDVMVSSAGQPVLAVSKVQNNISSNIIQPISTDTICSVDSNVTVNGNTHYSDMLNLNHLNSQVHLNPYKTVKSLSVQDSQLQARSFDSFVSDSAEQQQITAEIELATMQQPPPPTIILQQMPTENVIPTFIPSYPPQNTHQNFQYITTVDNQDKFISSSHFTPATYHIQSAQTVQQPVVQNVPTVVGTIIQTNGVEQIVLNGAANPSLDVYTPQQSNVYIANTPMIVGMETVVSNTVMSSSQFISASVPGMLAASSYSATTTQVFQATKPLIDIPQSYVVVNANTTPILENNTTCVQPNVLQNNIVSQTTPWNNLISYQDPYKMNKNVSYQTVTRQIIHEQKDIDGVKMINSTHETIVIEPVPAPSDNCVQQVNTGIFTDHTSPPNTFRQVQQNLKPNGQVKNNQVKLVELPNSSSVYKEKPQQAVAPVVVKKVVENGLKNIAPTKTTAPANAETVVSDAVCENKDIPSLPLADNLPPVLLTSVCNSPPKPPEINKMEIKTEQKVHKNEVVKTKPQNTKVTKVNSSQVKPKKNENFNLRKVIQEEPKITYEITSDDGFSYTTTDIKIAWEKVFEKVQKAREAKGLPLLTENPFSSPTIMLKKMMGLSNNSVKYVLEQLPGVSGCSKYKPVYHQKKLTALEREMSKDVKGNTSGCARTEQYQYSHSKYDMFSWLASRHRRPPKLLAPDNDYVNGSRRTNMNLPMAMRFRHLKETSNAVGVFRSDIHGRGLFCLRDIDSGEMVIEYAGEVIRSALTDKRERYYTAKGIGCYMFRIDDKFVVDATMKGNAARFINHSCEPNCYSKVVDILGKKHILIFAMRRILQGEELTYDYKFPLEDDKINCHCLSRRCRKYLN